MFANLLETQKPIITVLIFIGTFLGTLTIGRLLKRRAGVRLGVLFRLLCFTLAFYAAAAFYGLNVGWRNHVDAAAIWLGTAFIVALLPQSRDWLGPITPIGGLCFLAGWAWLIIAPRL